MIKLEPQEIQIIVQCVEAATIKGKDAPLIASILLKLEKEFTKVIEKEAQTPEPGE